MGMVKIAQFPTADRRQQVKTEKEQQLDLYDHMAMMFEDCGVAPEDALYDPQHLAVLCKVLMNNARRAKERGDIGEFNYYDDLAWQARSRNDAVTDILYEEGFLQEHGII